MEAAYHGVALPEKLCDSGGRSITNPQPDYLRRRSEYKAALIEVRIFGRQKEASLSGLIPDSAVFFTSQANVPPTSRT